MPALLGMTDQQPRSDSSQQAMADVGGWKFVLEVRDLSGQVLDPAEVAELRRGLTDNGALDAQPARPARVLDPLTLLTVAVGAVQAAAAITEVLSYLRAWREGKNAHSGRRLRVRVGGVELPAKAGPEMNALVSQLLRVPTAAAARRFALIIAVDSYDDPALSRLRSPAVDAQALAGVLGDQRIGGFHVEIVHNGDERTIRRQVARFLSNRDPDDLLLIHFSCHGVKDRQNKLHLAAKDTEVDTLGATAIPASFLDGQMAQTRARHMVLILDCCFSGAYTRDMSSRADRSVNIDDEFVHSGRVVLTASSATEYAFEGGAVAQASVPRPSVFTAALVNGLSTGKADLDGDGEISVDEWYTHAFREVTAQGVGQVPTKSSSSVSGAFIIAQSPKGAKLSALLLEDLNHDRVPLRLAAVSQLTQLVQQPGTIAVTARRELQRLQAEDDSSQVRAAAAEALGQPAPPTPPPNLIASPPATAATTPALSSPVRPITAPPPIPAPPPHQVGPQRSPATAQALPAHPPAASKPPNNTLAIGSFVTSIVGIALIMICPLITATGAILGHVAMRQCIQRGESGRGLALAAIIIGWVGTAAGILLTTFTIATFSSA